MTKPWIGVDLDGTLARHEDDWDGPHHIGAPVAPMVERVRQWLAEGKRVKIMTARVAGPDASVAVHHIHMWLSRVGLPCLEVTCSKDFAMTALYDDRAIQVRRNTGELVE